MDPTRFGFRFLGAAVLAGLLTASPAFAQPGKDKAARTAAPAEKPKASPYHYHPPSLTKSAQGYYQSIWGVDRLRVQRTASGNLVRFSYRVVDPARAQALGDDRATPALIAPTRGVSLQVPSLEQVGDLRQKGRPEAGKDYWMVFSNKGEPVKTGDRVNVVIGGFHADGLMVE